MISLSSEQRPYVPLNRQQEEQNPSDGWQNQLTMGLLKGTSLLYDPICYSSGAIHRIISPMLSQREDSCCSMSCEIGARVLYAGSLILTVPIGIVAGILAIPVRSLATAVTKENYCYAKGNGPEKDLEDSFSLMTWNICGLEGGMSLSTGGMPHWKTRLERILRTVISRNPDIIAFQEVQSVDLLNALFQKLKGHYSHCYYNLGIHPIKSPSGIVVFSKFPSKFSFTSFEDAEGWAKGENLGAASMLIGNKIRICFTHLQFGSDRSPEVRRVRESQINAILNLIGSTGHQALLAGDLNLDRNSGEFEASSLSSRFIIHNENQPTWTSYFIRRMWKGQRVPERIEKSIDYIAQANNSSSDVTLQISTERVEAYDPERPEEACSDHHALLAKVTLLPTS